MPDSSYVQRNWYRHNGHGVFGASASLDTVPVPFKQHAAHCEVWFQTTAGFTGTFTIYAVPTNATIDASGISIWVDGVYNQTVLPNVTTNLNKQQALVVNVGTSGAHVIRIQEGERSPGVFLTRVVIDGAVIPAPSIVRSYVSIGDSVSMGAYAIPRSLGWAQRMKAPGGSRFDSVSNLGQSGYSLNEMCSGGGAIYAARALELLPTTARYVGSTENVVAICLSLNDWYPSAASTSAATFQATLLALVDALKTAADAQGTPGFKLMLHGPTRHASGDSAPNDKGSTLAQFDAAIAAVQAARPSFTQYLYLFTACTVGDLNGDLVHPGTVGHSKIYDAIVAAT